MENIFRLAGPGHYNEVASLLRWPLSKVSLYEITPTYSVYVAVCKCIAYVEPRPPIGMVCYCLLAFMEAATLICWSLCGCLGKDYLQEEILNKPLPKQTMATD